MVPSKQEKPGPVNANIYFNMLILQNFKTMKQIKNTCLALGGFLLATLALSCKKDSNTAPPIVPAPTITSFTPTSANPGATITITGTNLTGATAVSFGGTAATSFAVTNATTITAVVGSGATGDVKVTTPGGSISKPGFTLTLPTIDGYNNSNEVGGTSLKAHWTFDSTKSEAISTAVPEKNVGTITFGAGKIGKAINLQQAYMIYPAIANLNNADALPSFTVSMWTKVPDNTTTLASLFQINGVDFQDIWGLIGLMTRTNGNVYSLGATTTHVNGTGTHPAYADFFLDPGTKPTEGFTAGADGWALITITYDGPSNLLTYYGNGVKLGTRTLNNVTAPETLALLTPNKVSFGTFEFYDDFTTGAYGHPPLAADRPWASHGITASLDDARVFNKALSDTEVLALFHLGQAGR
jgi:hypothetical protein